jgi:TetR/AcrR family transcriptional repressor of nem operon
MHMAGRPQIFDEAQVLNRATDLFWSRGYEATSMEDLLETMGIGKSSFYHSFGSKRDLFEKVLNRFVNTSIGQLVRDLETEGHPIEAIRTFFRSIAAAPPDLHRKGCFMGNTVVELQNLDKSLKELAAERLKKMEAIFLGALRKAQQQGELHKAKDPVLLARYLLTLWNGLNVTRRLYPQKEALGALIELQLQVLG